MLRKAILHAARGFRQFSSLEIPRSPAITSAPRIINGATNPPTPKEMVKFFDRHVIGQEAAKKIVAVAIYNHYCRLIQKLVHPEGVCYEKSNIMLVGPSGSGKTLLAKSAARILEVPFSMSDATGLTEAGYVGEDVDLLLWRLLEKSGYNLGLAQRGIVFLDEVDKIAKSQPNPLIGGKDVGGQGVQQALLKMIEGTVIDVKDRRKGEHSAIPFDTSSLLFIFSGAFNGLEQLVKDRSARVPLGFVHHDEDEKAGRVISKGKIKRLKTESKTGDGEDWKEELVAPDLIQFGMIPEFIGRIPVVAALNELDQKSLERILVEPEDSLISQYQQLFALNSTKLVFTPEAISLIASLAIDMDVGARGLRSIMEKILMPWMYETPKSDIEQITFDKAAIEDGRDPIILTKKPSNIK